MCFFGRINVYLVINSVFIVKENLNFLYNIFYNKKKRFFFKIGILSIKSYILEVEI